MHWPQYVIFGWILLEAGADIGRHGRQRIGEYDGWVSSIVYATLLWILYMGGFFGAA